MGDKGPTHVAGFDARGFVFGPPIALALGIPFVMILKKGKLPGVLASSGECVQRDERVRMHTLKKTIPSLKGTMRGL